MRRLIKIIDLYDFRHFVDSDNGWRLCNPHCSVTSGCKIIFNKQKLPNVAATTSSKIILLKPEVTVFSMTSLPIINQDLKTGRHVFPYNINFCHKSTF